MINIALRMYFSASFKSPARMDDELEVESWVEEWREKIFVVKHIVKKGNEILKGSQLKIFLDEKLYEIFETLGLEYDRN